MSRDFAATLAAPFLGILYRNPLIRTIRNRCPNCHSNDGRFESTDGIYRMGAAIDGGFRFLVYDYENPLGGSYLLEAVTLFPVAKGAKVAKYGDEAAGLLRGSDEVADGAVHGNSLDFVGETHVYAIRGPDGTVYKIGESTQGTRVRDGLSVRAEQQVRALNREVGPGHVSEILQTFGNKLEARLYETRLIERFRSMFGNDALPGNLTNR